MSAKEEAEKRYPADLVIRPGGSSTGPNEVDMNTSKRNAFLAGAEHAAQAFCEVLMSFTELSVDDIKKIAKTAGFPWKDDS